MPVDEPSDAPEALGIQLFGGFAVFVGSSLVHESTWRLRKAKSLLKLLALMPRHRLHRERALEILWPEHDPDAASQSLHRVLHALRHTLQPDLPPRAQSRYVVLRDDTVILCPGANLVVDVDDFTRAVDEARRARSEVAYERALALYRGDILPDDLYEDWTVARREQLCEQYVELLAEAARLHLQLGNQPQAILLLQRLIDARPAAEDAHLALIYLYAVSGRRYDALRQYQQLRDALRRELDAEPGPAAQRLYARIQAGQAPMQSVAVAFGPSAPPGTGTVTAEAGAIPSGARVTTTGMAIAASLTEFVGRARELDEVLALLSSSRLLTLTGAGGCGKSRLAIEAVSHVRGNFPDGAVVVELAALADPQLVPQAAAGAIGVTQEPGRALTESLSAALAAKRLVLVLDNCEHLREACAALCEEVLAACPNVSILATSRRRLRAAHETHWRVPSLATPRPDCLPPFERLLEYDAIRLFCLRATAASRHEFELTRQSAAAVVAICARLDGIPLAIELAARQRRYMTIEQIAARLNDALGELGGSSPDGLRRHETLRATLDWSYDLLAEPERMLFQRLAVFSGGWTLEAAAAICGEEPLERGEPLNLLARLVDESLIVTEKRDAAMRYRFLEPIHQYARAKLTTSGEAERVSRRHAKCCCALAEEAATHLRTKAVDEQREWLHRLDPELDNLRAALRWSLDNGELQTGLRLAVALKWYWYCRNLSIEGRRWMEELLGCPGSAACSALRADVLYDASALAMYQGDLERAADLASASQDLCRELQDTGGVIRALVILGCVAEFAGDYVRAAANHSECLDLARQAADIPLVTISLSNLADVAAAQGDLERAHDLYDESLRLARRERLPRNVAMALTNLGKVALRRGEPDQAELLLAEALAMARALEEARGIAENLLPLGHIALLRGNRRQALTDYAEALDLYHRGGFQGGIAQCMESLAQVAMTLADWTWATRLCACASALRERALLPLSPAERQPVEHALARAKAALRASAFAEVWAEGRVAPLDQLVSRAADAVAQWQAATPDPTPERRSNPAMLTPREREISRLLAEGLTDRAIAARLNCSVRTVEKHAANIRAKGGSSRHPATVAAQAAQQGKRH
jgi:predicted ATPase/DNA-binding SARP family transcriptional activator/DNA-binding CsgD family transcriptional regulator